MAQWSKREPGMVARPKCAAEMAPTSASFPSECWLIEIWHQTGTDRTRPRGQVLGSRSVTAFNGQSPNGVRTSRSSSLRAAARLACASWGEWKTTVHH